MDTLKKFKIEESAIKLYVYLTGIGFTIYCGLLCVGLRHSVAEWTAMTLAYILLCGGIWMYRMCWLTWAFAGYGYLIRTCIIVHREGMFGEYVDIAHYMALSIGIVLTMLLSKRILR